MNRDTFSLKQGIATLIERHARVSIVTGLAILVAWCGVPQLSHDTLAQDATGALTAQISSREIIIRYSRLSGEEPVGVGINSDYAEVAALAFQGRAIAPEKISIEPLYKELVDEMRSQNLNENLAALSLISKYQTSSERFLASTLFEQLQERNSRHGFSRAFVVRFTERQDTTQIVNAINKEKSRFRAAGLVVRASLVTISPISALRQVSDRGTIPVPVASCTKAESTVAIVGDQFVSRKDLPQLSQITVNSGTGTECDSTEYKAGSVSFGTNLAGVVTNVCPTCKLLGFDVGCGVKGNSTIRSSDGVQAILGAVLRGASVILLTTADAKKDSVYDEALSAATSAGVAVIAPSGDNASSSFWYPAASKGVIGVLATNKEGVRADFSNYGPWVVSGALGVDVVTTHKETNTATFSGSALAAARVAGFIARHIGLNPQAALHNLAVLASSGFFSTPDPKQCDKSSLGESTTGSGGGSGTGGGSGSGSGSGTGGSSGTGSGGSSGGGSTNPATPTGTPTATPTGTPTGVAGSSNGNTRALATLKIPDTMQVRQAGLSPFMIQKFRSQFNNQGVKVGVSSISALKVDTFKVTQQEVVADVVYKGDSAAEIALKDFTPVAAPTEVDKDTKEYLVSIAVPEGIDIRQRLLKTSGVVGVYLRQKNPTSQPAISGISARSPSSGIITTASTVSTASVTSANEAALEEMGWREGVTEFTGRLKEKVKVAIISTGADYESSTLKGSISSNLLVTSSYVDRDGKFVQGDFPTDIDGFGTQVLSLLGHERLGVAKTFAELIPIKVATSVSRLRLGDLVRGIALAVNKGAEVIVLPHDFVTLGCDPVLGHAIYKAREKGVTFVVGAGDGLRNATNEKLGFPVVAARDDGPASYEATSSPACWSRYFLGALSFAAAEGFAKPLPDFSNYGDDIELSAMGVGIDTVGLKDASVKSQGTAFSAAWGAAAAAMAIAHHKTLGFKYGAWYIENLLVASAKRDPNAMATERRNRFGSLLNFTSLVNLLVRTESMTDSERRNGIETINPRQGDGWKPGEDKANLKYVALTLGKSTARPGEEVSYKVVAYFRSGEERDVTSDATYTRISIQAIAGKKYIELIKPGTLKIVDAEAFKLFKGPPTFTINANFSNEQAQGFDSKRLRVDIEGKPREVTKLTIQPPKTPVRVGQEINLFSLTAEYSNGSSEDATGGATWSTSVPGELRASLTPGLIDSRNAVAGKTYTVSASFGGKTAEISVTVVAETLKSFYVHNYLGIGGKIERGQKVTLEARMILSALGVDREQAIEAVWFNGSTRLNGGTPVRSLTIDTSNLPLGTQTYKAVATFRTQSGTQEVTATISFVIADEISRIEIHMKTPIVQVGQPLFIDLRAYRHNNSYVVVTEDTAWSTDAHQHATINRQGVGFISEDFPGSTLTIRAEYKGQKAEIRVAVIRGSVVTGSNSLIDYLTLDVQIIQGYQRYCNFPHTQITAKYKDGSTRQLSYASRSFAEQDEKGAWREAQLPLYGGKTYRASATYNDGSVASGGGGNSVISTKFVMPRESLEEITFDPVSAVIFRNAESNNLFSSHGVCKLSAVTATPDGILPRISGDIYVYVPPTNIGAYTVTAQGNYTGMGTNQVKEGSFRVIVRDTVPTTLVIKGEHTLIPVGASTYSQYGSRPFDLSLFDADRRRVHFKPEDLSIEVTQGKNVIGTTKDHRVRLERLGGMSNHTHQETIWLHAYPQSLGEQYKITARHSSWNISGSKDFVDVGSWESSDSTPWNLPSREPAKRNETLHPACETYLKNPTGLEFAAGTGTDADPLVICDKAQLTSFGVAIPWVSSYCRRYACKGSSRPEDEGRHIVLLGANIDFRGERIRPIRSHSAISYIFEGDRHSIGNYVIVDSEASNQALFGDSGGMSFRNLIIDNPTVRGDSRVASLVAGSWGIRLENVQVNGGVVWGKSSVGGAVFSGENLKNVRVFGTVVNYERTSAGGIASDIYNADGLLFSGRVAPSGVPGYSSEIGGIVARAHGTISNSIMTGDVIALNSYSSDAQVGGIAGRNHGFLINSFMEGNVVSTGSGVGGVVGVNDYAAYGLLPFGLDRLTPNPWELTPLKTQNPLYRQSAIVRAKVTGNVWGGMSRKQLECIDKVATILGVGGSTNCIGDIKSQQGGRSNVGGIAGINWGLIQDSEFTGTVRGISAVGGIAGSAASVGNYVRNTSAGVVSASEGATEYGALIGYAPFLLDLFPHRLDSNVITSKNGNPEWAMGTWGKEKQVTITSNVPDYYDANSAAGK